MSIRPDWKISKHEDSRDSEKADMFNMSESFYCLLLIMNQSFHHPGEKNEKVFSWEMFFSCLCTWIFCFSLYTNWQMGPVPHNTGPVPNF